VLEEFNLSVFVQKPEPETGTRNQNLAATAARNRQTRNPRAYLWPPGPFELEPDLEPPKNKPEKLTLDTRLSLNHLNHPRAPAY
jgi:hypothetical protein